MSQDENKEQVNRSTRGDRKRARTRADLLAAARQVFAQRGYHEATVTDITQAADVGVGTFYLHFRDKEVIFVTLIEQELAATREQVIAALQRAEQPTLSVAVHALLYQAYERRDVFRIAMIGGGFGGRRFHVRDLLTRMCMEFFEGASDILPFSHSVEDLPLLAQLTTGVIIQAIFWWFEHDLPEPDTMFEHVIAFLQNGLPMSVFSVQRRPPQATSDASEEI